MKKMKLNDLQACLWHLQNVSLMMNGTEFDELGAGIKNIEESLNDVLFTRLEMAKEVQKAMNEHNEGGENGDE